MAVLCSPLAWRGLVTIGAAAAVCSSALLPATSAVQIALPAAKEPLGPFRGFGVAKTVLGHDVIGEGGRRWSDAAGADGGCQPVAGIPERQRRIQ